MEIGDTRTNAGAGERIPKLQKHETLYAFVRLFGSIRRLEEVSVESK